MLSPVRGLRGAAPLEPVDLTPQAVNALLHVIHALAHLVEAPIHLGAQVAQASLGAEETAVYRRADNDAGEGAHSRQHGHTHADNRPELRAHAAAVYRPESREGSLDRPAASILTYEAYPCILPPVEVVWDEDNIRHLLEERGNRQISLDEIEDVLRDPNTIKQRARSGRWRYIGKTRAGRCLAVVAIGNEQLRPETAWQTSEKTWRRFYGAQ